MFQRVSFRSAALFLCLSLAALSQIVPSVPSRPSAPVSRPSLPVPSQRFDASPSRTFALGPIDDTLRDQPSPRRGVTRIGVTRALAPAALAEGTWQTMPDGSALWRLTIKSPNALGIRLHFASFAAGEGQVWVHDAASPATQTFGPYTGSGHFGDGDFWTEAIFASAIEIEYQPASNSQASGLPPFALTELTHLWQLGPYQAPRAPAIGTAASALGDLTCFADVTCYESSAVVYNASHAEAMIEFGTYQCSATILNAPNGAPLILTAGHCINTQSEARSTEAFFDVRTAQCNQGSNSYPRLSTLPQAMGQSLLAFSNKPFLDGSSATEIQDDLDYSLVQLQAFPNAPDLILSGYDPGNTLAVGAPVTSVSFPLGLPMRVAFATRAAGSTTDGSFFNNAFDINMSGTGQGRVDEGSSGSGIFNAASSLVGVLSTIDSCPSPLPNGNCPATYTTCSASLPFNTWYTKFSAIYPNIATYLNHPLAGQAVENVTFTASPNPVSITDGSGLAQTTFTFNDAAAIELQIRVGSPTGPLLSDTANSGQVVTGKWVTNGMTFYLQDVSNGKALTSGTTAATLTITFPSNSFDANPGSFASGLYGRTTLSWSAPDSAAVEIHVGSPGGVLFAAGPSNGTASTGDWATAGLPFYLIDANSRSVLSTLILESATTKASLQ